MQVSAQNSLTWLQTTPAAVAASDQTSSAYGQVSPSDDASGAEQGQSAISALQSPSQMFSPASLNTLISSQSDPTGSGAAASASSGASATSGAPLAHHHHHHGGGPPPMTTDEDAASTSSTGATTTSATTSATTTSAMAAADDSDASVEADLTQMLGSL